MRALTTRLPREGGLIWLLCLYLWLRWRRGHLRPCPVDIETLGFRMRLDQSDFAELWFILLPQLYEPEEIAFLQRHLRPGDVFVDVGAHLGLYALLAARAVGPTGRVLAVEADPETYGRLRATLAANGATNVTAVNLGAADARGTLRLGLVGYPMRAANSFLYGTGGGIEVPAAPLAEIIQEQGLTAVRGMKLDIEGMEFPVLHRFFADAPPRLWPAFIITEYHEKLVAQAGGDAIALLESHGYRTVLRRTINYMETPGHFMKFPENFIMVRRP